MQTTMTKNIALAGHAGSGKTTLCEALLYQSGVTERIGKITEGMDIVDKIATCDTDWSDAPMTPVVMKTVTVDTFGETYPEPEKC